MVPLLLYFRRYLCSFLSSRITAAVQYLKTRSYMHVESSDPVPYHLRIDSTVSPFPLSSDLFDRTRAAVHHSPLRLFIEPVCSCVACVPLRLVFPASARVHSAV